MPNWPHFPPGSWSFPPPGSDYDPWPKPKREYPIVIPGSEWERQRPNHCGQVQTQCGLDYEGQCVCMCRACAEARTKVIMAGGPKR